jgi:hypothetical protein
MVAKKPEAQRICSLWITCFDPITVYKILSVSGAFTLEFAFFDISGPVDPQTVLSDNLIAKCGTRLRTFQLWVAHGLNLANTTMLLDQARSCPTLKHLILRSTHIRELPTEEIANAFVQEISRRPRLMRMNPFQISSIRLPIQPHPQFGNQPNVESELFRRLLSTTMPFNPFRDYGRWNERWQRAVLLLVLLSPREINRVGIQSILRDLPPELVRRMIPFLFDSSQT